MSFGEISNSARRGFGGMRAICFAFQMFLKSVKIEVYSIMTKIKDIPKIDRPREKMEKYGTGKLSDAELLAILLRTGTKDLNVLKLAQKILQKFEREKFVDVSINDLKNIHGIGTVKACEIIACFELGRRMLKGKKSSILLSPKDVWERMEDIRGSKKEHFVVFYLDSRNQEIQREIISIGTLNASLIHPREVFEPAIKYSTAQIIIAHNHPSNLTEPSEEDVIISKRLIEAGKILDIEILDHIIVSKNEYKSMKELSLF
ncbi:MAG: repair protein [Parcubacteria group bacterium GW2011_GWB1_36_5]|nr:MAG: repair protein [Parcubacteria group bacterium GW2011_GWB1_36_5]